MGGKKANRKKMKGMSRDEKTEGGHGRRMKKSPKVREKNKLED